MAEIISTLTIIFITAAITLWIFKKLNHPAVPAYILAGLITGYFIDSSELLGLAELGISFLVFVFGIKYDPSRLKSVAKDAELTSVLSLAVVLVSSLFVGILVGLESYNLAYFVLACSLSSSLIGLELLEKEIELDLIHGRLSESINLIQDFIGIIAIIILSTPVFNIETITQTLLIGFGLLTIAILIREFILDFVARQTEGSVELLMLTALSTLAFFISIAEVMEISPVVGAFAAGLSVSKFPHNLEIMDSVGSLKDFFSAIFFVALGALVTTPNIESLVLTGYIILFTVFLVPLTVIVVLLKLGYDSRTAYLTGFSMDQVSEYVLVIVIQALVMGMISENLFNAIILSAVITMTFSSYTSAFPKKFYNIAENTDFLDTTNRNMDPESDTPENVSNHVVIIGYDVQGELIVETLEEEGIEYVVVENDPLKIEEAMDDGINYVYGNIKNYETWERAKAQDSNLIVSTAPFRELSESILNSFPNKDVMLRSKSLDEAEELIQMGALYVAVDKVLASDQVEDYVKEVIADPGRKDELRRRKLLEIRKHLYRS